MAVSDTGSATTIQAVVPSDTTIIRNCRALWVGGSGNVAVIAVEDNAAQTFLNVPAGTILAVSVSKVMATNTTATGILALG
jgi:hypothetical protein